MLRRVETVLAGSQGRWPLCADAVTGEWTYTRRGSWVAGFWCGLLWLRARRSGEVATAAAWTGRLGDRLGDDTITRAMTFWYGAGAGALLAGDRAAAEMADTGAAALLAAVGPIPSAPVPPIPVGGAFGMGVAGRSAYSIDAVAALIRLLGGYADRTGDPGPLRVARAQLDAHLAVPRPAGTVIAAELHRDPASGLLIPAPDAFRHTRGQAWGLLALADAAAVLGDGYRQTALAAADGWQARHPAVPDDTYGVPAAPDTSAALIAAVALTKLSGTAPHLARVAAETVAAVVRNHLSGDRLLDTRYAVRPGERVAVESVWGMFFLLQALEALDGDPVARQL